MVSMTSIVTSFCSHVMLPYWFLDQELIPYRYSSCSCSSRCCWGDNYNPIYRVRLKNDSTRKMWLLGNTWKFLRHIWHDCLAGLCSLMYWFCLKLLHVYEIGIKPNFKFGFCNYTSLYLLRDVKFRTVIAKFTEKVETELRKVDK